MFVCSFIRMFVCSFNRLFMYSFVHSFVRPSVCSFVRSFSNFGFLPAQAWVQALRPRWGSPSAARDGILSGRRAHALSLACLVSVRQPLEVAHADIDALP